MRTRALVIVSCFAAGSVAAVAACLDTTPLFVAPVVVDAGVEPPPPIDAGPDAPDVDTRPPCQSCIETPDDAGCANELATCNADPKCKAAYDCMIKAHCLSKGTQTKIVICGIPCAADAGIVLQNEPAANEIYDVAVCAQAACKSECLADGG